MAVSFRVTEERKRTNIWSYLPGIALGNDQQEGQATTEGEQTSCFVFARGSGEVVFFLEGMTKEVSDSVEDGGTKGILEVFYCPSLVQVAYNHRPGSEHGKSHRTGDVLDVICTNKAMSTRSSVSSDRSAFCTKTLKTTISN